MPLSTELLAILRCSQSRAPLVLEGDYLVSSDPATRRRYRVEDGIPNMILEESEVMTPEDWEVVMKRHGSSSPATTR
jgi:uncharacterized protein YbaR (Trm112 family)